MRMLLCGEEALKLRGAYEVALQAAGVSGELQAAFSWDEVRSQLQDRDGFAFLSGEACLAAYEGISALGASSRLSGGVSLALSVRGRLLGLNLFGESLAAALEELLAEETAAAASSTAASDAADGTWAADGAEAAAAMTEASENPSTPLSGARVVLVGTDNQACSCVSALAMAGADDVIMVSEDKERAAQVMTKLLGAYSHLAQSVAGIPSGASGQRSFAEAYSEATFRYAGMGSQEALSADAVATVDLRQEGCEVVVGGSKVPQASLVVAAHFVAHQVQGALGIVGQMRDVSPDDLVTVTREWLLASR